jgi:hypothetical protein
MLVYETYGAESVLLNSMLLIPVGILVNGPNCLIATAVAAELGTHPVLMGNSRALATVTAIIDGTGSIGEQDFVHLEDYSTKLYSSF